MLSTSLSGELSFKSFFFYYRIFKLKRMPCAFEKDDVRISFLFNDYDYLNVIIGTYDFDSISVLFFEVSTFGCISGSQICSINRKNM